MPVTIYDNHKLVTPGVGLEASTGDIESALGSASTGDLGTICQHSAISRWAKYKPVVYASLINSADQLNSDKTWKSSATWWKGSSLTYSCGIQISRYTNLRELIFDWYNRTNYEWKNYWRYIPPTGGDAAPFRQIDFNYYMHPTTASGGEDADKPLSGWMCGGQAKSIVRYQMDGVFMTDGQAQLYVRSDHPYLISIGDLKVPSGAAFAALRDYYFTVVVARWPSSTRCLYALESATETFNQTVPAGSASPQGSDMRITPTFPSGIFDTYGEYLVFPLLTSTKYSMTSWSEMNSSSSITGEFIPLPFYPITVNFTLQAATLRITPTATATKYSGGSITLNITYTAVQLISGGTNSWGEGYVKVLIQFFKGQQSPPQLFDQYEVPAGNTSTGTYHSGALTFSGTSGGTDFFVISLETTYGYIAVGPAYNLNV